MMEPIDERQELSDESGSFNFDSFPDHELGVGAFSDEFRFDSFAGTFHEKHHPSGNKELLQLSLEEMARDLERSVPVRDNRYRLTVYHDSFVGSECVDYLVRANFASSRADAVDLGRRMAKELNLFEHVTLEHELKDDFYFYRFIEDARRTGRCGSDAGSTVEIKLQASDDLSVIATILRKEIDVRDRTYRLRKYKDVFVASEAVTVMIENDLAQTREEAVELGRRLQKEVNLWHHVCRDHIFKDDYLFFRYASATTNAAGSSDSAMDLMSDSGSVVSLSVAVQDMTTNQLHLMAEQLRRGLRVKDRRYRFRTYKSCFVASEAVDFMVRENLARSREEAVDLGRLLAKEFRLWYHVTNDHYFSDRYLFFRFAPAADQNRGRSSNSCKPTMSDSGSQMDSSTADFSTLSSQHSLSDVASKLVRGIQVKDRIYKLRMYKSCFVGAEAVDFIVQARITSSREEAVELGQRLMQERDLFHHVKRQHTFKDAYLFYRFSNSTIDDDSNTSSLEDAILSEKDNMSSTTSIPSLSLDQLVNVGEQLRRGVRIKNRSYRFKTYKNCFVASEAVDYLVQSGLARSREMAVEIIRRLESELDFLYHVTNDHVFDDSYLFFRFNTTDRTQSTSSKYSSISSQSSTSSALREFEFSSQNGQRLQFEHDPSLRRAEYLRLRQIRKEAADQLRIVLVEGESGSGKSALVHWAFAEDFMTLYAASKFDQRSPFVPFQALRLLFVDLCKQLRFSPHIAECQTKLKEEFKDARVLQSALSSWIPEMRYLFMESCEDEHLKRRSDVMYVMKLALQSFLRAVTSVTLVVLCLDDIMWSDEETLDILQFLLNRKVCNLVFCATLRDDVVTHEHRLSQWRSEVAEELDLETIRLQNLAQNEIQDFLANCLKREPEDLNELSELLLQRTHGNIYFLVQTLESLQDLSLLRYDFARLRWDFCLKEIRSKTLVADNVGELLSTRITQLPRDVQQVLKLASCFGNSFDPEIVERAKSVLFVFEDLYVCLQMACKEELLIRASDREFVFSHDHVQSAAYGLLPNGHERKRIHWDIGNKLSTKQLSRGEDDSAWYFAGADQLTLSEEVMFDRIHDKDRPRLARLFLRAGEKAAELSAFVPAASYFKTGIDLLGKSAKAAFSAKYDTAAKLFIAYAKAQLSAGKVDESRRAADFVLAFARTEDDKRAANLTIFHCLSAENKIEEQVDFGLSLLEEWGHKLPRNPNFVQLSLEYDRARKALRGYSDEEILSIPQNSDKNVEVCIDLMCDIGLSGNNVGRGNLVGFIIARLVQLTLTHGLSKYSPFIFVLVGQDIIASFNDLKEGYRFVQVGLRCQTVIEAAEQKGRLLTQSCTALGCVEPLSKCMYLGLDAYKASMEVGDMHNAFHGASVYLWSFFYSGLPFKPLLDDVEKFALQMLEYKQTMFFFLTTPIFQLLLCLSGQEDDPADITKGRAIEMNSSVESGKQEETGKQVLLAYGMQLSFYMGKMERATEIYEQLKDVNLGVARATAFYHVRLFFFALICVENFRSNCKSRYKGEAKKHMDTLRELVEGGAINLVHKVDLLDAEYSSLSAKDTNEVIAKYEKAGVKASRAGFLQDGALAAYLCARHCLREGQEESAVSYLARSYELYSSWGAVAVAASIKERHFDLFARVRTPLQERQSTGFHSRTHFRASLALMHQTLSRRKGLSANPPR